jgi:hypothetical protein
MVRARRGIPELNVRSSIHAGLSGKASMMIFKNREATREESAM